MSYRIASCGMSRWRLYHGPLGGRTVERQPSWLMSRAVSRSRHVMGGWMGGVSVEEEEEEAVVVVLVVGVGVIDVKVGRVAEVVVMVLV